MPQRCRCADVGWPIGSTPGRGQERSLMRVRASALMVPTIGPLTCQTVDLGLESTPLGRVKDTDNSRTGWRKDLQRRQLGWTV